MTSTAVDVEAPSLVTTSKVIPSQPTTKSFIVDQELNRHDMGRYQWLIWAICGTGFFLDIAWAQALNLSWSNIQREFGFSDKEFGNMTTAFMAGLSVGALVWGVLVDVVGRRVAFLGTSLIAGVCGMCVGAQSSYTGMLVFIAFTGVGIGGNIPIDATITAEYIPEGRFYLLAALSIFQPLGTVTSSLIALGLIPPYSCSTNLVSCNLTRGVTPCCSKDANMGWRYLLFTMASITLAIFIIRAFIFPFYESPRFLISKGNDEGAVEVIQKIAAFNKQSCDLTVESLFKQCKETPLTEGTGLSKRFVSELSRLKLLFGSWRMARVTIVVWIVWVFNYWGFIIASIFLPTILQRKNGAIHIGLRKTFIDYLTVYTPGFAATIISVFLVRAPMVGRKWTMVFSSMLASMSLFLYSIVNTEASHVGFNALEYFCQCLYTAAVFGWTPEAFPSAVRGTATGLASFLGSLVGTCSPLIAERLFSGVNGSDSVLYLAGSSLFVCTLAFLCLPTKDMVAPR